MRGLFEDLDYGDYWRSGERGPEKPERKEPVDSAPRYHFEDRVSDAPALRKVIEESKQALYGGKVFDYAEPHGFPQVGFAAEKKDAADERVEKHIAGCFATGGAWIMPATRQVTLDLKTDVFLFPLWKGEMSVRRAVAEKGTLFRLLQDRNAFLLKLLQLTEEYWQNNTEKIPLAFCPDTVFVSEHNGSLSIRILPIYSAAGKAPAELPNDGITDASGDAFAAVLLAHEAACGYFKSDGISLPSLGDVDSKVVRVLLPFSEFRPRVAELIEELSGRPALPASDVGKRPAAVYVESTEDHVGGRKPISAERLKERFSAWMEQLKQNSSRNKEARAEDRKGTIKYF